MPLELASYDEIIERSRTDLSAALASLDPTIFESLIAGIVEANGGRHFDNTLSIKQLFKELFPDSAELENLQRWSAYDDITPNQPEQSVGSANIPGVAGTIIESGRVFKSAVGNSYTTQSQVVISNIEIGVASITRSGSTVTVITNFNHNLASLQLAQIVGANEADYNGEFAITVITADSFTYEIATTPSTPATGTITTDSTYAKVTANSNDTGFDQNLDSGALFSFVTPLIGADDGRVDFNAFIGGADLETKESLLTRTKQRRANPVANFNIGAIDKVTRSVAGVTRLKIKRITPDVGDVTILFVRDGDDNIIPSAAEAQEVKDAIVEILPATSNPDDVYVIPPTPVETDYLFASISPDTPTMRSAIKASISAFYEDGTDFETPITEDVYRAVIIGTLDPDTGQKLTAFALNSPVGDINISTNSIGIPGQISF